MIHKKLLEMLEIPLYCTLIGKDHVLWAIHLYDTLNFYLFLCLYWMYHIENWLLTSFLKNLKLRKEPLHWESQCQNLWKFKLFFRKSLFCDKKSIKYLKLEIKCRLCNANQTCLKWSKLYQNMRILVEVHCQVSLMVSSTDFWSTIKVFFPLTTKNTPIRKSIQTFTTGTWWWDSLQIRQLRDGSDRNDISTISQKSVLC